LKVPKLRSLPFDTAIIERYRRETSVEEALLEMYYAGVSMRRVEDITVLGLAREPQHGERAQSEGRRPDRGVAQPADQRRARLRFPRRHLAQALVGRRGPQRQHPRRHRRQHGYREVLGVAEGAKEDKAWWQNFRRHLASRGLKGVPLFIADKCLGLVESLAEFHPAAAYQRCAVHFHRNVWSLVPATQVRPVAAMLKAIHASEDREAAHLAAKLYELKLPAAAALVRDHLEETLSYYAFPSEHQRSLRTNNPLERIMRQIRRRPRVVGAFPDGNSALLLVSARLRHIAGKTWGTKRYMDMSGLREAAAPSPTPQAVSA
jgi:transposase-like protein